MNFWWCFRLFCSLCVNKKEKGMPTVKNVINWISLACPLIKEVSAGFFSLPFRLLCMQKCAKCRFMQKNHKVLNGKSRWGVGYTQDSPRMLSCIAQNVRTLVVCTNTHSSIYFLRLDEFSIKMFTLARFSRQAFILEQLSFTG